MLLLLVLLGLLLWLYLRYKAPFEEVKQYWEDPDDPPPWTYPGPLDDMEDLSGHHHE